MNIDIDVFDREQTELASMYKTNMRLLSDRYITAEFHKWLDAQAMAGYTVVCGDLDNIGTTVEKPDGRIAYAPSTTDGWVPYAEVSKVGKGVYELLRISSEEFVVDMVNVRAWGIGRALTTMIKDYVARIVVIDKTSSVKFIEVPRINVQLRAYMLTVSIGGTVAVDWHSGAVAVPIAGCDPDMEELNTITSRLAASIDVDYNTSNQPKV